MPGGLANNKRFTDANQALPWPGLPAGTNAFGNSHRWDASASGHLVYLGGATTNSTGNIVVSGVYTGYYPKTYTITITNSGNVSTSRFNWTATSPGGGSGTNILTAAPVALDSGISLKFYNGSNISFQANDKWQLYVRTDLHDPTNTAILVHITNGVASCSACHDQHSQARTPFDPNAATNYVAGVSSNRHFMRIDNNAHQLCLDCHAARNVNTRSAGIYSSHPVGLTITTNGYYKLPAQLPLDKTTSNVVCLTCHQMHFASVTNGMVLRLTNTTSVCVQCHLLADTNTPAAHLTSTNANMLWPGGQYGSLAPARTDTASRGSCVNCHTVHGWPDASNPATKYPTLLVERQKELCYTCHDSDGPAAKRVMADFDLACRHPVPSTDPYRRPGRSVECTDCHHVHDALPNAHIYTSTATSTRNQAGNPSKGVSGVALSTNGLVNFQNIHVSRYSSATETNGGVVYQYQICFKCHSGYSFVTNSSGTATFTTNSATVTGSGTSWDSGLTGMWIGRTNDTRMYVITAVASATSLTITPAYAGSTGSGQGFNIFNMPAGLSPLYRTGTANFTTNSTTVAGTGTSWHTGMIGMSIWRTNSPTATYRITGVASATSMTIYPAYAGPTTNTQGYVISATTDIAQEFSPMNRSGHPIFTGLNNYPNSLATKPLAANQMLAPWNTNLGSQTMMCTDCHDTTTTNYIASAAAGPHGSANQYMLRGPNGNNWPDVQLSNYASSWCANCHQDNNGAHAKNNHANARCYNCHIVIPHGGKMSRLMGSAPSGTFTSAMPARYAFNGQIANMWLTYFQKPSGNYSAGSCGVTAASGCSSMSASSGETWP